MPGLMLPDVYCDPGAWTMDALDQGITSSATKLYRVNVLMVASPPLALPSACTRCQVPSSRWWTGRHHACNHGNRRSHSPSPIRCAVGFERTGSFTVPRHRSCLHLLDNAQASLAPVPGNADVAGSSTPSSLDSRACAVFALDGHAVSSVSCLQRNVLNTIGFAALCHRHKPSQPLRIELDTQSPRRHLNRWCSCSLAGKHGPQSLMHPRCNLLDLRL